MKGGEDGPIVAPGRADRSEIVRRIWLPSVAPGRHAAAGTASAPAADAALVRWWIDGGARSTPGRRAGRPARRAARDRSDLRSDVARRPDHSRT